MKRRDDWALWIPIVVLTPLLWPALVVEYVRYKPFHRGRA
jgi:hypothetical protein